MSINPNIQSASESWSVRELHTRFAAELDGHQIGPLLSASLRRDVVSATHRFGVIVIPHQDLSDDQLYEFARSIGKVTGVNAVTNGVAGVFRLTNLDNQGAILPATDKMARLNDANELWHTDSTYLRPRARISLLHARIIPPMGGNTEFCDTRCALEDMDSARRTELAGLIASHSLIHSRALTGFTDWTPEERQRLQPIDRPLIHRHPESGRIAACLAAHIAHIKPLAEEEAQRLLRSLIDAATVTASIYTHRWHVGDLLLWDNRCTMHRARPYDQLRYGRDMRSVRLDDEEDQ